MKKDGCLCVLLDCSRNAVMSLSGVKGLIDTISALGYNALQLYTEDTYEISGEPLFGYMRGRYTKEELKEIDGYARAKGVELIPCIQTLGHLDQLFPWKRFQRIQDIYNILFAGEEESYQLIEKMFATCAECFTSRKINLCMDEAHMLGLGKYLDKHGYTPRSKIFLAHLDRVCEIARKYGFSPMIWSDMFFKLANTAQEYGAEEIPAEVIAKIPRDVQLIYWDYESVDETHYEEIIKRQEGFKRPLWFAGSAKIGRHFQASNEKMIRALKASLTACRKRNVNNVVVTIWGDYGNECATATTLPALAYAASEYYGEESVEALFSRVVGESLSDFLSLDLKMPADFPKGNEYATGAKTMLYSDYFLGRYDSMVFGNGAERAEFAKKAEALAAAKKRSKNYAYLFDYYEKLCTVLAIKYDLGYYTRRYYQSGEREKLRELLIDYERLPAALEELIEAARTTWYAENKPHGFDVFELRLGGLLQRTKSCTARLRQYLAGQTESIPELEEKLVVEESDPLLSGKMTDVGNYPFIATVNRT